MKTSRDKIKQVNYLRISVSKLDGTDLRRGAEKIICPWWTQSDAAVLILSKLSKSMLQLFLSYRNRAQLELSNATKMDSKCGWQGLWIGGQLYSHKIKKMASKNCAFCNNICAGLSITHDNNCNFKQATRVKIYKNQFIRFNLGTAMVRQK